MNKPQADIPRILVADDTGDSRQLLVRLLQRFTRAHVIEARNGAQALDAFGAHGPGLCFLDIDMPEVDGLAVLREIRQRQPGTFVVIVSATSSFGNVKEALSLGAGGYVVKPYSARRIIEVIRKYEALAGCPLLVDEAH